MIEVLLRVLFIYQTLSPRAWSLAIFLFNTLYFLDNLLTSGSISLSLFSYHYILAF